MLEPEELNALLGDPTAHATLFTDERGFKQPRFQQLKALVLKDKFENAAVRFTLGMNGAGTGVQCEQVKIAKVTLEPMSGGLTALSCQVQAEPAAEMIGALVQFLSREISIEIIDAKRAEKAKKQGELPINTFGEGEQGEQGKAGTRRRKRKNADAETLQ